MLSGVFHCLNIIDLWLAEFFAELPRLALWGFVIGGLGLTIYAACSNQAEIGRLKREARDCRRRLLDFKLDDLDFTRLNRRNIEVSLGLLARVGGPALVSAAPIFLVASWMDARHAEAVSRQGKIRRLPAL